MLCYGLYVTLFDKPIKKPTIRSQCIVASTWEADCDTFPRVKDDEGRNDDEVKKRYSTLCVLVPAV